MKKPNQHLCGLIVATALGTLTLGLNAQNVVTQETVTTRPVAEQTVVTNTSAAGAVTVTRGAFTEYTPGTKTVIIRSESQPEPVHYLVTQETAIVDQSGQPVMIETLKSGIPAEVHYVRTGQGYTASRIVVHSVAPAPAMPVTTTEKKTTTTVTRPMTEDEQERLEEQQEKREEIREEIRERAEDLND